MNKQAVEQAVVIPVTTVFLVMTGSIFMYQFSKTLDNDAIHQVLAFADTQESTG